MPMPKSVLCDRSISELADSPSVHSETLSHLVDCEVTLSDCASLCEMINPNRVEYKYGFRIQNCKSDTNLICHFFESPVSDFTGTYDTQHHGMVCISNI